jgi:hypothetical protein
MFMRSLERGCSLGTYVLNVSGQDQLGVPIDPESRRDRRKRRQQDCDAAWQAFPDLEGTHWTIRLTDGRWAIATRDGEKSLATINGGKRSLRPGSRSARQVDVLRSVREVHVVHGAVYRSKSRWWYLASRFFVDVDSGEPVIKEFLWHHNREALGSVQVRAGEMAVRPQNWRFPVEETTPDNAVMTAVDDLGNVKMRFRRTLALREGLISRTRVVGDDAGIDIVLSPDLKPSPIVLLIAAVASQWMITYFTSVSGPAF